MLRLLKRNVHLSSGPEGSLVIKLGPQAWQIARASFRPHWLKSLRRGTPAENNFEEEFRNNLESLGLLERRSNQKGHFIDLQSDRFDRYKSYLGKFSTPTRTSEDIFENIQSKHLLFLGVGSLASWALIHAANCGVKSFTLVDDDVVEASNLARQAFFSSSDIGRLKIEAAKDRLNNMHPDLEVTAIKACITGPDQIRTIINDLKNLDLVVLTADKPLWKIAPWTYAVCRERGIPLIRGNSLGIGPFFIDRESSCVSCLKAGSKMSAKQFESVVEYNEEFNVGPSAATSPVLALAGSLLGEEIFRFVSELLPVRTRNSMLTFKENDWNLTEMPLPKHSECEVCGNDCDQQ